MAMKPYVKQVFDRTVRTDRYGNMTIYNGQLQTTDRLSGVVTRVGDGTTPNPHAFTRYVVTSAIGKVVTHFSDGSKETLSGVAVDGFANSGKEPASFSSAVLDSAKMNLWDKVRNGFTDPRTGDNFTQIDLSVDLIQYRQTMAMANLWKGTVNGLASHGRHFLPHATQAQRLQDLLNRGNIHFDQRARYTRELDRHLDILANARLQYVYGWKPTVSTISDLAKLAVTPPPGTNGGWVKVEGTASRRTPHDLYSGQEPKTHYSGYLSERAKVTCWFAPKPSVLSKMAQISSLNVVALIYEATPYSFVLDWMSNTGEWLRSVETAMVHGSEYRGGFSSEGQLFTERISRIGRYQSYEYNWLATRDMRRFRRTTNIELPIPKTPHFEWNFGLNQALNATALLKQKFRVFDAVLAVRGR